MEKTILHLRKEPFEKIKEGKKIIEIRLYDDKRRKLKVGDKICFALDTDDTNNFDCEILNMLVYDNFAELFSDYDKSELGYDDNEEANPDDMLKYYNKDDEAKYGVVAIEVELC